MNVREEASKIAFPLRHKAIEQSVDKPFLRFIVPFTTAADLLASGFSAVSGARTAVVLDEAIPHLSGWEVAAGGIVAAGLMKALLNFVSNKLY